MITVQPDTGWRSIPTGLLVPPNSPITIRASYGNTIVAETTRPVIHDCRPYFPPEDVDHTHLTRAGSRSFCPITGVAEYYTVTTEDGDTIHKAAWAYRRTLPGSRNIRNHIAFWRGVNIHYHARPTPVADE